MRAANVGGRRWAGPGFTQVAGAVLLLLSASALAQDGAAACQPSPLGQRELFLRGSFNNWSATETQQFVYRCNRYELLTRIDGDHQFKIADEDWSADADFGGNAGRLVLKGQALSQRFSGHYRLVLTLPLQSPANPVTAEASAANAANASNASNASPQLSITTVDASLVAAATADLAAPAMIKHPIARSLRFDSRALGHKSPFGAVTAGSTVQFTLTAQPQAGRISRATLVIEKRRLEGNQEVLDYSAVARVALTRQMHGDEDHWSASFQFKEAAIYGYYFEVETEPTATAGAQTFVYQNNKDSIYWTREKGSMGVGLATEKPASANSSASQLRRYRQTVYAADFTVPTWARDAVYYYIFPDRFRNGDRSNDPKPGIDRYHDQTVELHKQWLERPSKPGSGDGFDEIYNNDFFGGDLAGVIEKLDYIKALGANTIYMTPIFRAASNHKYDTADYLAVDPAFGSNADFQRLTTEAAKRGIRVIPDASLNHTGSDSRYFDRFGNFGGHGAFAGGKINPASPYADWYSFDATQADPDKQYKGWVGVTNLPELNKASASFRNFAYGAPDSVMKTWLDLGAAGWRMDVAPWLPDDFWREWRAAIKTHRPDALTIAETWFDASKFFLGDAFDSTMNYIFRGTVLDYAAGGPAKKLYANIELMREAYPPQAFFALMNLLSTHDQARALHHFGYLDDGDSAKLAEAKQRLRLAVFFQMIFPGSPSIYYGDEVGLAGGDDPYNRATYPWADQGGKPDLQLLADFKQLTQLRAAHAVLRHGSITAPLHLDEHLIVLARQDGNTWAITATNNGVKAQTIAIKLPAGLQAQALRNALTGESVAVTDGHIRLTVPALFGTVLITP